MRKRVLLAPGLLGLVLGCVGPNELPKSTLVAGQPERVVDRSYTPGAPRTVKAGEVLFEVRDTWAVNRYPNYLVTDRPLLIQTANRIIRLPMGQLLTYANTVTLDQATYVEYVNAHDDEGRGEILYFTPDLTLARFLYVRDKLAFSTGMEKIARTEPGTIRFPGRTVSERLPEKGETGRQGVFLGCDGQGIHVLYRECAGGDWNHPTAVQPLVFPEDQPELDCRGTRIRVQDCSGNRMTFAVVE